ncbi:SSI family serine proteinase inhibitor [Streptomyces sp. NPDC052042]|uniref:SSI family serine proteinase inhibitor n=1 Tax=Streptomyces sp. NPDC052042 TaxID=3365683 RepID=UPI0037D42887
MRLHAVLATTALLALTAAAPATAAPSVGPAPEGDLFLTVSGGGHTWIRGVGLVCPPRPGGHHPHTAAACADIAAAGGDLDALPGDPHLCTKEFDPVTAEATGIWDGRRVSWRRTFSNACELDVATGPVFRF